MRSFIPYLSNTLTYWRHRIQLQRKIMVLSKEHSQYLDAQLQRTLSKKSASLPQHTQILVDKLGGYADLQECRVLCVGCRNIKELNYFRQKGAQQVTGIDLYSEVPEIEVMDMHAMTFDAQSFDVVYSSHSLEHSNNPERAIAEFVRVTRPGGWLAIEVPIRYETRGTDLVDFQSVENLCAQFERYPIQVIWREEADAKDARNDAGTAVARAIFSVETG
jgi:SAM-dependent methyltransferase